MLKRWQKDLEGHGLQGYLLQPCDGKTISASNHVTTLMLRSAILGQMTETFKDGRIFLKTLTQKIVTTAVTSIQEECTERFVQFAEAGSTFDTEQNERDLLKEYLNDSSDKGDELKDAPSEIVSSSKP